MLSPFGSHHQEETAYKRYSQTSRKINPDLTSYVVDKATLALFDQIEKEEANIRANPVARTTEILKKSFWFLQVLGKKC